MCGAYDSADSGRPTAEVQNICGQRHGRVVLSLVRELAFDCNSSQPWKPYATRLQLQFSRLLGLVVWSKVIEATRLGDFIQPLVPYMARHSGPSIDAGLGTRTRKEIRPRPVGMGPQRASIRAAITAPQIVPPSASGLQSLHPEMRKRVAQGDFRRHSDQQCSNASRSVASAWRLLRGAVQCSVRSWTKTSTQWFPCWLVSSQSRTHGSSQAPLRCSNGPCAWCSSLSILCLLVTLSRFTRGSTTL